jgi:Carbohydrate-binding family 9
MKVIEVKREVFSEPVPALEEISDRLDKLGKGHKIDILNWDAYTYKPDVRFNIAYGENEIFMKYYVREDHFKAEKTETNQMVCEDSCVEFFVSPLDDAIYYNIEFNAIGTCLLGSGTGRHDSKRASAEIISGIRRMGSAGREAIPESAGKYSWTLTIAIPLATFFHHRITELKGKTFRANFYKCGDMLSVPHYVTWNAVGTEKPDYHRPEYFGMVKFS